MGTALVLLFLLALGAIPGALLPQRSLNAGKVDDYLAAHPLIGPWLDRLQAFNVFGSFWFTADLHAAVRVAAGLPDPADDRARPQPAGNAGARPPQPGPAAQARHRHVRR